MSSGSTPGGCKIAYVHVTKTKSLFCPANKRAPLFRCKSADLAAWQALFCPGHLGTPPRPNTTAQAAWRRHRVSWSLG